VPLLGAHSPAIARPPARLLLLLASVGLLLPALSRAPAAPPSSAADGTLLDVKFVGDYPLASLQTAVPAGITLANGYRVYTISFATGGRQARAAVTVPSHVAPPPGGFHVVGNSHGTTGLGDPCAVVGTVAGTSLAGTFGARGFVGVALDYPGLGTPGLHPYLVAASEGRAALDALRATRALAAREHIPLSGRFALVGMSQGGHATLAAAALHKSYAPDLDVRAFAVAAPAIAWEEHWREGARADGSHLVYHAMLIHAWATHYNFRGPSVWAPGRAPTIAADMERYCAWSPRGEPGLATRLPPRAEEIFSPAFLHAYRTGDWGPYAPFHAWFEENRIRPYRQTAPLKIYQGDADVYVPEWTTRQLVSALRDGGVKVDYEVVRGGTHFDVAFGWITAFDRRTKESIAWLRQQLDTM
jgi:hypothetical protein